MVGPFLSVQASYTVGPSFIHCWWLATSQRSYYHFQSGHATRCSTCALGSKGHSLGSEVRPSREFEATAGPGSNLAVNWCRAVQERVREFAAVFSANGRNRDGWLWPPESHLRNRERRGGRRNRRNPL